MKAILYDGDVEICQLDGVEHRQLVNMLLNFTKFYVIRCKDGQIGQVEYVLMDVKEPSGFVFECSVQKLSAFVLADKIKN